MLTDQLAQTATKTMEESARDELPKGAPGDERNPLRIENVCETVREDATGHGGIRTHTPNTGEGILSPQRLPFRHVATRLKNTSFLTLPES
jgi:hypothetical protein